MPSWVNWESGAKPVPGNPTPAGGILTMRIGGGSGSAGVSLLSQLVRPMDFPFQPVTEAPGGGAEVTFQQSDQSPDRIGGGRSTKMTAEPQAMGSPAGGGGAPAEYGIDIRGRHAQFLTHHKGPHPHSIELRVTTFPAQRCQPADESRELEPGIH